MSDPSSGLYKLSTSFALQENISENLKMMNMTQRKVHSQGNVPFAWENQPGISKTAKVQDSPSDDGRSYVLNKLPPPPCQLSDGHPTKVVRQQHDIHIPLPPCPFIPPATTTRSSSRKGSWGHNDPFLAAYKECTKSDKLGKSQSGRKSSVGSMFSCKHSCGVREDSLVRVSQLPLPNKETQSLDARPIADRFI